MKTSRRNFIRKSALLASLTGIGKVVGKEMKPAIKPIVVSTWNFGVGANAEAWKFYLSMAAH